MGVIKRMLGIQDHMCQYDTPLDGYQRCIICGKMRAVPGPGCQHNYKKETFEMRNGVFDNLESVKVVMTCNKCGDIQTKTIRK